MHYLFVRIFSNYDSRLDGRWGPPHSESSLHILHRGSELLRRLKLGIQSCDAVSRAGSRSGDQSARNKTGERTCVQKVNLNQLKPSSYVSGDR